MRNWNTDGAALLLRLGTGLIFIPHGYPKAFGAGGPAAFAADMPSFGIPVFLGYVAAYAEFFGGIALLAGLLTRVDAFLLGCTMAVAAFRVQLPDALYGVEPGASKFFAAMRGIEMPLALLVACAALVLIGGGRLSIDALLRVDERVAALLAKKKAAAEAAVVNAL